MKTDLESLQDCLADRCFAIRRLPVFSGDDLGQSTLVPLFLSEMCSKISPNDFPSCFHADHAGSQTKNVEVVVLYTLTGGIAIVAQ